MKIVTVNLTEEFPIDYSDNFKMRWLTSELQELFNLVAITTCKITKKKLFNKIAKVRKSVK